jgi:hypothetical protein
LNNFSKRNFSHDEICSHEYILKKAELHYSGVCTHSGSDHLIIDFGEGIRVSFAILDKDNLATNTITVNHRAYSLEPGNRRSCLYFRNKHPPALTSGHAASGKAQ